MASLELPRRPQAANFNMGHPAAHIQPRRETSSSHSSESDPDEYNKGKKLPQSTRAHERTQLIEEYETEYNQRPMGLGQKAIWLLNLEEKKESGWYLGFYEWYKDKLREGIKRVRPPSDPLPKLLRESHGKEHPIKSIAKTLEYRGKGQDDFFYLGNYGGYGLALSLNPSALDPPVMPFENFTILDVLHARLKMFAGIRPHETKDLCVLTLGNVWSTKMLSEQIRLFSQPADLRKKVRWLDTKYVLAVDTVLSHKLRYYLIYRYEVDEEAESRKDDSEERKKEPEGETPPTFYMGSQAFTIGLLKKPQNPVQDMTYENVTNDQNEIELEVLETKKPQLALAGYKDEQNPFVPLFLPRDKSTNI